MVQSRLKVILASAFGVVLLAALVGYVGPRAIVDAVRQASPVYLLLAFLAYALFFLLRGIRWRMLFSHSAPDVRLSSTTGITAVGWLANSILPLKGGDVLRAAVLAKRDRVGLATSASSVALERVLDLLGIAAVAAAGLLILPRAVEMPPGVELALKIVWILPLAAIGGLALLVRFRPAVVTASSRLLRPAGRFGRKVLAFLDTVLAGLHALASQPRLLARLLPLTLAVAGVQALVFTFLVMAFVGVDHATAFAGSALFLLSFIISVTPGNVGTYEAAFAAVFVSLGVAAETAVPAAILTHVATTLIVTILGTAGLIALGLDEPGPAWRPTRVPEGGLP